VDDPQRLQEAWRYDEWLNSFALTNKSVLDYFAYSPYYQKNSLNDLWKLRGLDVYTVQTNPIFSTFLKESSGFEYIVRPNPHEPQLFIIERRLRNMNNNIGTLSLYYCLHGTIFQIPNLQQLISSRIERSSIAITRAANHALAELYAPPGQGASNVTKTNNNINNQDQPQHINEYNFRNALEEAMELCTTTTTANTNTTIITNTTTTTISGNISSNK